MPASVKCPRCGHAAHKRACRAKGPSRCVLTAAGRTCGYRPPCPCPWQVCSCGLPVAVAHLDGTDLDTAVERGSAGAADGTLAVMLAPDGSLTARELDGGPLAEGEWRGREHLPWPDHGKIAARYGQAAS